MEKKITATQAVRDFSELLNTIKFGGDRYIIERNGKPVAYMEPVKEAEKTRTLKELIGSTALTLGFSVATFNRRDFERIEGLTVEMLNT